MGSSWENERKGREIPKITLVVVKNEMLSKKATESMIFDRIEWKKRIYVGDPD